MSDSVMASFDGGCWWAEGPHWHLDGEVQCACEAATAYVDIVILPDGTTRGGLSEELASEHIHNVGCPFSSSDPKAKVSPGGRPIRARPERAAAAR